MADDIEAVDPVEQCFEHFGILGMKWGRRRSRQELQSARGKKDWESDSTDSSNSSQTSRKETDNEKYQRLSRMNVKDMSTQEINDWVNRTNAIANYNRLTAQQRAENQSKGHKFVAGALSIGKKIAIDSATEVGKDYLKSYLKSTIESHISPSTPRHAKKKKKKKK